MRKIWMLTFSATLLSACGSAPRELSPGASGGDPAAPAAVATPAPSPLPGLYHRIYQGYVHAKLKPDAFVKTMNAKFLPLFPKAHPQGLVAYRPALPKNPNGCALPGEVALLSFESEKRYAKYRDSRIGKRIRDAHGPVFRADASKSLVPAPLVDTIHFERAYSLNPGTHDYRKSHSFAIAHCDPVLSGEDLRLALVKAYAAGTEAADVLFAVAPAHVIEYVFYPRAEDAAKRIEERKARFHGIFRSSAVVRLPKRKIGKKKLAVGQGVDAQW